MKISEAIWRCQQELRTAEIQMSGTKETRYLKAPERYNKMFVGMMLAKLKAPNSGGCYFTQISQACGIATASGTSRGSGTRKGGSWGWTGTTRSPQPFQSFSGYSSGEKKTTWHQSCANDLGQPQKNTWWADLLSATRGWNSKNFALTQSLN